MLTNIGTDNGDVNYVTSEETQFRYTLRCSGVETLSKDGSDDVLLLDVLGGGIDTPSWASQRLSYLYVQAKEQGEALFQKFVPVALAITKRSCGQRRTSPLQLLAFPGSCLFNALESGVAGSNNAVIEAVVHRSSLEEGSANFFCFQPPRDPESPWNHLETHNVAVKILHIGQILSKGSAAKTRCIEEINIAQKVCHAAVIRTFHVCEAYNLLFLIMEYADRGDLVSAIRQSGSFSEDHARYIFAQIISGVGYLHSTFIIHRDIKPENVLLRGLTVSSAHQSILQCQALLADFGAAFDMTQHRNSLLHGTLGTLAYAAPEILRGKPYRGEPVDIWSLGVVLFAMVFGRLPWSLEKKTIPQAYAILKNEPHIIPTEHRFHGRVSPQCRDLIAHLITVNPHLRITLKQVQNHPWMTNKLPLHKCPVPRLVLPESPYKRIAQPGQADTSFSKVSHPIRCDASILPHDGPIMNRNLLLSSKNSLVSSRSSSISQATTMSSRDWPHQRSIEYSESLATPGTVFTSVTGKPADTHDHRSSERSRSLCSQNYSRHTSSDSLKTKRLTVTKAARVAAQYIATAAVDVIRSLRSARRPPAVDVFDLEQQNSVVHNMELHCEKPVALSSFRSPSVSPSTARFEKNPLRFQQYTHREAVNNGVLYSYNAHLPRTDVRYSQDIASSYGSARVPENVHVLLTDRRNPLLPLETRVTPNYMSGWDTQRAHTYKPSHVLRAPNNNAMYSHRLFSAAYVPYGYTLRSLLHKAPAMDGV